MAAAAGPVFGGGFMKALAVVWLVLLVAFISAVVVAVANAWWPVVAAQMVAGWLATAGVWLYRANRDTKRWRAIRALLVEAYNSGGRVVSLDTVVALLGGEEVRAAQRERAMLWASRYANGDASDY
jgi:hypothetical protein